MRCIALFILITTITAHANTKLSLTQQLEMKAQNSSKKGDPDIKKKMQQAHIELKNSGIVEKALKKNTKAPEFNIDNKAFSTFYSTRPVVLKFYRGSWCPYCELELKVYEEYKSKIEAKGYQVIIITPDTEKEIKKFKAKEKISFAIYSDSENKIAKKFGIAFKIGDELNKVYKGFGIDLEKSQGNQNQELPLPGTYIINKEGIITYAFIDVDYKKRLDPEVLLTKL